MNRSILFFGLLTAVLGATRKLTSLKPYSRIRSKVYPLCIVQVSGRVNVEVPEVKCIVIYGNQEPKNAIARRFLASKIVPNIIDEAPTSSVTVTFPNGAKALLGNVLTPTLVRKQPLVTWNADKETLYTLLMTDADGLPRTDNTTGEIRHWLVVNIPGNNVSHGQTVYEYIGSAPDPGSFHRYVFLVFKQTDRVLTNEFVADNTSTDQQERLSSSTRDLIQKYNLENPVFGNFYQAEYDNIARIIRNQVGFPIITK